MTRTAIICPVISGPDAAQTVGDPVIRIVIVDDHEVLRAGTRQIISEAPDMAVVGEAADAASAVTVVRAERPDVVLLDIRLPDRNGIDLARQLTAELPDTAVIIISAYDDHDYVEAALDAGVRGYLLKTMPGHELVGAVRAAAGNMTVLDPVVTANLRRGRPTGGSDAENLTWREQEVAALVAEGLPNKTIARRLSISARTVEGHLNHIFAKLGLSSRTELVRFAISHGLTGASDRRDRHVHPLPNRVGNGPGPGGGG